VGILSTTDGGGERDEGKKNGRPAAGEKPKNILSNRISKGGKNLYLLKKRKLFFSGAFPELLEDRLKKKHNPWRPPSQPGGPLSYKEINERKRSKCGCGG